MQYATTVAECVINQRAAGFLYCHLLRPSTPLLQQKGCSPHNRILLTNYVCRGVLSQVVPGREEAIDPGSRSGGYGSMYSGFECMNDTAATSASLWWNSQNPIFACRHFLVSHSPCNLFTATELAREEVSRSSTDRC